MLNNLINNTYTILIFCLIQITSFSCRKSDYLLENTETIWDNGGGTGTVTWKSDKEYIIDGLVFVNDGQILNIEPGTVIKGKSVQSGFQPSALVVARGGKIIAKGTSDDPIIFTSEQDDPVGSLPLSAKGLWGGVIILGNALVNVPGGEEFIEGIPISEPRGIYGGNNEDDNSGIFSFVSIRHAGIDIGEENEINGLTLGGVGKKTQIDHVEVISSGDDGFEFFGGNVSCKNLIAAFCRDDAFDFDQGYSGKLQFILGIKDDNEGDCIAEHSDQYYMRGFKPEGAPVIYNATFIGNETTVNNALIRLYDNGAGIYRNSLFLKSSVGIEIEYKTGESSYAQFERKRILVENNIFYGISVNNLTEMINVIPPSMDAETRNTIIQQYFTTSENIIQNPGVLFSEKPFQLLPSSTIFGNMAESDSPWFDHVSFKGAFGSRNWAEGWSLLWQKNIIR